MKYAILLEGRTRKTLDALSPEIRIRVIRKLESLQENPRPPGVEKLSGAESLYRVRVGDWRIVFAIQDRALVVIVIRIGHRREVYR